MYTNKISKHIVSKNRASGIQIPAPKNRKADQSPQSAVDDALPQRAKRGGGPRTNLGKQRSRGNALKLGIFSKVVLVKGESRAELSSLRSELRKDLKPEGALEELLVDDLVELVWRLRRPIIAEVGEIRLGTEFLEADQTRHEDDEAANILLFEGVNRGHIRKIANPIVLSACLIALESLRKSIEMMVLMKQMTSKSLKRSTDFTVRTRLFGRSATDIQTA